MSVTADVYGAERRALDFDSPDLISKSTRQSHNDPDHHGPGEGRLPMPNLLDDLRTPQQGPVDPEQCLVCQKLREVLAAAVLLGSPTSAGNLVRAAHQHMLHGHPNDQRTQRAAPAQTSRKVAQR